MFKLPVGTVIQSNETITINFNIPDTIGYIETLILVVRGNERDAIMMTTDSEKF